MTQVPETVKDTRGEVIEKLWHENELLEREIEKLEGELTKLKDERYDLYKFNGDI